MRRCSRIPSASRRCSTRRISSRARRGSSSAPSNIPGPSVDHRDRGRRLPRDPEAACRTRSSIQAPGLDESCACNRCPFMRLNTLEKLYLCLRERRAAGERARGAREAGASPDRVDAEALVAGSDTLGLSPGPRTTRGRAHSQRSPPSSIVFVGVSREALRPADALCAKRPIPQDPAPSAGSCRAPESHGCSRSGEAIGRSR